MTPEDTFTRRPDGDGEPDLLVRVFGVGMLVSVVSGVSATKTGGGAPFAGVGEGAWPNGIAAEVLAGSLAVIAGSLCCAVLPGRSVDGLADGSRAAVVALEAWLVESAFIVSSPVILAGWTLAWVVLWPKVHKKRANRSRAASLRSTGSEVGLRAEKNCWDVVLRWESRFEPLLASLGGWVGRGGSLCGGWGAASNGIAAENFASGSSLG